MKRVVVILVPRLVAISLGVNLPLQLTFCIRVILGGAVRLPSLIAQLVASLGDQPQFRRNTIAVVFQLISLASLLFNKPPPVL